MDSIEEEGDEGFNAGPPVLAREPNKCVKILRAED